MASLLVTVGGERVSGICCFFDFNQKQAETPCSGKSMTKSKVHMS